MCQIFAFDTFTTPNTKIMLYEMCQISKIIQHSCKFATVRTNVVKFFIVFYSFSLSSPFIFSFLFSLTLWFPLFSLKPQSSPLKPHSVSLSPTPCFSRHCRPARPRCLCAHQDADFRRRVLRLRRSDPVAHRARFFLRPVHRARFLLRARFQHDRVDRLGQGGDRAWVDVVDCWGDL